jgi:lipopolysaccharide transport system ATP-binding protein
MRFLRKFREHGTILFVSHDTAAVVALCQGAYWLHQGMIRQSGTPKEVSEAYLADFFEAQQGPGAVSARSEKESTYNINVPITSKYRDMRCDFINATNLRNDIELFQFQPDAASFGQGGAHITSVVLADETGAPLIWVVGGENIRLIITCRANKKLVSPIIGFFIKDRLGQILFGDNTFLAYMHKPIIVEFGHEFQAQFDFCMPILPAGDYSICAAVAEGTQHDHVQHQWLHDALMLRSHSSSVCTGLVGVPVQKITLSTSRG